MNQTEQILEFDKIKEQLIEFSHTEHAKEQFRQLIPSLDESEVRANLRKTTEAVSMLITYGNPPIGSMSDSKNYLDIAEKGDCLSADQLEQIERMLTGVMRLKDYLNRCKSLQISLPFYEENLKELTELRQEIEQKIRAGQVDDYATTELKNIRAKISQTELKMRDKADTILRANKTYMSDQFTTQRSGRICLPVRKEYRHKINGTVLDKSSTGSTLFIEPESIGNYYNELTDYRLDEENEVRRILYTLTSMVLDEKETFIQNKRTIDKLDAVFAKAKLSLVYDGKEPILHKEHRIRIMNGRHPLMAKEVYIPLNFEIGGRINGIIITGPNTGGKTVAIKTVALLCYMVQCGLHIPCEEAEIGMSDQFLCDIGDGQNLTQNLSTFSSHIKNVLEILQTADKESLVIMDELGSGTDPAEGMGIAISILEELDKIGCLYLVTTHYPEVKHYAEQKEGVQNARMEFDRESLKPLYQMIIGEAGESCALHIAHKLGMPKEMLTCASIAAYGKDITKEMTDNNNFIDLNHNKSGMIKHKKDWKQDRSAMEQYQRGDSVIVYPDQKVGIVCIPANEKGILQVQLSNKKKIWISHKRIKLLVAAGQLYPQDYDFSIIFDSVEVRKARHQMSRKHDADKELTYKENE